MHRIYNFLQNGQQKEMIKKEFLLNLPTPQKIDPKGGPQEETKAKQFFVGDDA